MDEPTEPVVVQDRSKVLEDLTDAVENTLRVLYSLTPQRRSDVIESICLLSFKVAEQAFQRPFIICQEAHANLTISLLQAADINHPDQRRRAAEYIIASIFGS